MKKICCDCGEEKDLEKDFYKDKSSASGYKYYCKVCSKERSRVSHEKHYESMKAKHYEWMANHPEHKEYVKNYNKDYRKSENFEKNHRGYQWKYAHTEKGHHTLLMRTQRYRFRSRALINDLTYEQLLTIKESQQNLCKICHREFNESLPYELDHIFPVEKSKPDDPGLTMGNVQLLCRTCNAIKHTRVWYNICVKE